MKRILTILTVIICVLIFSVPVLAAEEQFFITSDLAYDDIPMVISMYNPNEIRVQLNGDYIDFTDENGNVVSPKIINDRTMVPMRKIFEVFGMNVEWVAETRTVIATNENKEITLTINSEFAKVKDNSNEKEIILDSVPVIVDDRTLVPVRFIAESLELLVDWDADNRTVIIINTDFVENRIKEEAPRFYELLTLEYEPITTFDLGTQLTGKIKYTDSEDKANDSTININGKIDFLSNGDVLRAVAKLNLTGKGILFDTINKQGYETIDFDMFIIPEEYGIYISSNLFKTATNSKWIKYSLSETEKATFDEILSANNNSSNIIKDLANGLFENANVYSYYNANSILSLVLPLVSNENLSVSGRNTKTYIYKIDMDKVISVLYGDLLSDEVKEEMKKSMDFDLKLSEKYENKIINSSEIELDLTYGEDSEKITLNLETTSKFNSYNDKISIKLPSFDDVAVLSK